MLNFANGFLQLVTKPTLDVLYGSATLIDHLYTNVTNKSIDTGILTTTISDHFAVFSQIATKVKKNLDLIYSSTNLVLYLSYTFH